jgi:hypothetical protein
MGESVIPALRCRRTSFRYQLEALIRLFYGAAERAASVPIEVAPTGLIIEAEGASLVTRF